MPLFSPDEAAVLIEEHRQELFALLVRRVMCPDTANDLLHDLYFRIIGYRGEEPVHNPRAFMYRIAANLATDHLRKSGSSWGELPDIEEEEFVDPMPRPDQVVFDQQQLDRCERTLESLPPLRLKILVMSRFEGYSHQQIAEHLNISVSWVEKNIIAAMKQLKRAVRRDEI